MSRNPLSPAAVVTAMAQALPTHEDGDTTSDLSSSLEAVALFTHACMTSLGFRLVGFSEDKKIETQVQQLAPRLPRQWNVSVSSLSFVYAHTQSSMQFVVRIDRMGGKVEVRGLAVGDERIARVEITARDYISSAALPVRIPLVEGGAEDRGADLEQRLKNVFISESRMEDLATLLKLNIVQRLLPSLQKEGYEEDPDSRAARQDADAAARTGARPPQMPEPMPQPTRPYPLADPLVGPPRRPMPAGDFAPPGFEDEHEVNRPPRMGGGLRMPGGRSPYNIGHDDLNPPGLGPHDPLRASFVGGGLPRPGWFGGMHPTFDDPLFQGPGGQGGGFDPQAPPGARWDPTGPGGAPRFGGGRPGGGGFGGFGGDII